MAAVPVILLVIALVLFALGAFSVKTFNADPLCLGMMFLVAALLYERLL